MKTHTYIAIFVTTVTVLWLPNAAHAQGAAGFLRSVMKGASKAKPKVPVPPVGGKVPFVFPKPVVKAPAINPLKTIKVPLRIYNSFHARMGDGTELHKNDVGGLNAYNGAGSLVSIIQPNSAGGMTIYDASGALSCFTTTNAAGETNMFDKNGVFVSRVQ